MLKSTGVGLGFRQATCCVVPHMKRPAKARHQCRLCRLRAPSGRCLDPALKSGRCGDWIWYMRGGKQCRRRYARPKDPGTLAQLLCRARLSTVSRRYGRMLTQEERDASIAAGAKLRSRPRMGQSGPLTGQQYWVRKDSAHAKANVKPTKAKTASQVPQPKIVTRSTSGLHLSPSRFPPERRRLNPRLARNERVGRKLAGRRMIRAALGARSWRVAWPARRALSPPGHAWRTPRVTRNTSARRLRQSKAPGAVEALR